MSVATHHALSVHEAFVTNRNVKQPFAAVDVVVNEDRLPHIFHEIVLKSVAHVVDPLYIRRLSFASCVLNALKVIVNF